MGMGRLPVKIRLDLSRHCIETEIKRLYNRSVALYFKDQANKQELEIRIEVLKEALERLDFPFLRSRHPILSGSAGRGVFLAVDAEGDMCIISEEEVIRF